MCKEEIKKDASKTKCPCNSSCPLTDVLSVIGGKWKIPILCALSLDRIIRYNELKQRVSGITNTMLANSLKELEQAGLLSRQQYSEIPVRVEYSLTEKGKSILPVLNQLKLWSTAYISK
jgi:DNA-binding HxlR family transcriptional regulator